MNDKEKPKKNPFDNFPNEKVMMLAKTEEPRIISILMRDKDLLENSIASGLSFEHFSDPVQRQLYAVMARYFDEHQGSILTRNAFESIVTRSFSDVDAARFRDAFDSTFAVRASAEDYSSLKKSMEDRWLQASAFMRLRKHYELIMNATSGQKALVEAMQSDISEIAVLGEQAFNKALNLCDVIESEVMPEIYERRDNPDKFKGMMSGFQGIDNDYNGFVKGRYLVIVAMEGGGKTTFMLNLARNFALGSCGVVFVTIESPAKDIAMRLATIHSCVNYNRIMNGGTNQETGLCPFIIKELEQAKEEIITGFGKNLCIIQVLEKTPRPQICRLIDRKRTYMKVDVAFFDYLQVIGKESSHPNRPDLELSDVSNGLRSWGRERGILTVTGQQIKTDKSKKFNESRKDDVLDQISIEKSDISGTKEITGSADHILGVHIPRNKERLRVFNVKNRQGKDNNDYDLVYDPNSGRLDDLPGQLGYKDIQSTIRDNKKMEVVRKMDIDAVSADVDKDVLDGGFNSFVTISTEDYVSDFAGEEASSAGVF